MASDYGCFPPPAQGLYDPSTERDACGVGFVVHMKGRKSHAIVRQALAVLINLLHRGACGCEPNTGDGAGILLQMPDRFLRREGARLGINLPPAGQYGSGLVFLPRDLVQRDKISALIGTIVAERAVGLCMKVIAFDPFVTPEAAARLRVELVPLEQIFARADFITIHTPLTAETRGILGERELALMKPSAVLVNVARAEIVDEEALYQTLRSGAIAGAILDVWYRYPTGAGPPLPSRLPSRSPDRRRREGNVWHRRS